MDFEGLENLSIWNDLTTKKRDFTIQSIAKLLDPEYRFENCDCQGENYIAAFRHIRTNLEFLLLPGGRMNFGLSSSEKQLALGIDSEIEFGNNFLSAQETLVEPFLASRKPVQIREVIEVDELPDIDRLYDTDFPGHPFFFIEKEIAHWCSKAGFSIPTESQREYFCRGGTTSLFYCGNEVPEGDQLEFGLAGANLDDPRLIKTQNPFGGIGFGISEWCESYKQNDQYVVRGGAAEYWPWQNGSEWVVAISSFRREPDELDFSPPLAGLRPVVNLSNYTIE